MSSGIEDILENKTLPELFVLFDKRRFHSSHKNRKSILEKIDEELQENVAHVSKEDKIRFTKKILELPDRDIFLCHKIIKSLWKWKTPAIKQEKEAAANEVVESPPDVLEESAVNTSLQDVAEEKDDQLDLQIWEVYDDQCSSSSSVVIQDAPSPDRISIDDDPDDPMDANADAATNGDERKLVDIIRREKKTNTHFNLTQVWIDFKILGPGEQTAAAGFQWFFDAYQEIIDNVTKEAKPDDKMLLTFSLPERPEISPVRLKLMPVHEVTSTLLLDEIEEVSPHRCPISICDTMSITANIIHTTAGRGRNYVYNMTLDDIRRLKRRSAIDLGLEENCLPIALLIGEALLIKDEKKRKSKMLQLRRTSTKLNEEIFKLTKAVTKNNPSPDGTYDLAFIRDYVEMYKKYRVIVYDNLKDHLCIRYRSPRTPENFFNLINIFYHSESQHFFTISNLKAFFTFNHFCEMCDDLYNSDHICGDRCAHCAAVPPCAVVNEAAKLSCIVCKGQFMGVTCYTNHKLNGLCDKLLGNTSKAQMEVSGVKSKCLNCNAFVENPHYCYVQRYTSSPSTFYTIVFISLETKVVKMEDGVKHVPYICATNTVCHKCYQSQFPSNCPNCDPAESIFESTTENCLAKFIDYITDDNEWPTYVISYNAREQDMQYVLEELNACGLHIEPRVIGRKVCVTVNKITFTDSSLFIPTTWNHAQENATAFQWYNKWYDSVKEDDVYERCMQKVGILRDNCVKFMKEFMQVTSINPFNEAKTICDAALKVYTKNFMCDNTLALSMTSCALNKPQRSNMALKWLQYIKETSHPDLEFGYTLPSTDIIVDGCDVASKCAFDFLSCFYHGDASCHLHRETVGDATLSQRYEIVRNRMKEIISMGYNLFVTWECEFLNYAATNEKFNEQGLTAANYSVRREVFKRKINQGDKIFHYRFNDFHTWIKKHKKFFVGHPKVIKKFENPQDILNLEGVAKCRILPPQKLNLPCLPYKHEKEVIYPLCAKCITGDCMHCDEERSLVGYWCIDEIKIAISKGYKILESYEMWLYDCLQYDRAKGDCGLFAGYVDKFLKLKQEACGWPNGCLSNEAQEMFCREFAAREGITLNPLDISANSRMYNFAEMMLKSLWDALAHKEEPKITICTTLSQLNEYLMNEHIEIEALYPCGADQVITVWHLHRENTSNHMEVELCAKTNARIVMYNVIADLGENILLCDDDSVIFVVPDGKENPLKMGMFPGQMTDIVGSKEAHIDEFIAETPKTYGIAMINSTTGYRSYDIHYKGISMNQQDKDELYFKCLKSIVNGLSGAKD